MLCLHCGKRLTLLRKLTDREFCCDEHRRTYLSEQETLGLARLIESTPLTGRADRSARPAPASSATPAECTAIPPGLPVAHSCAQMVKIPLEPAPQSPSLSYPLSQWAGTTCKLIAGATGAELPAIRSRPPATGALHGVGDTGWRAERWLVSPCLAYSPSAALKAPAMVALRCQPIVAGRRGTRSNPEAESLFVAAVPVWAEVLKAGRRPAGLQLPAEVDLGSMTAGFVHAPLPRERFGESLAWLGGEPGEMLGAVTDAEGLRFPASTAAAAACALPAAPLAALSCEARRLSQAAQHTDPPGIQGSFAAGLPRLRTVNLPYGPPEHGSVPLPLSAAGPVYVSAPGATEAEPIAVSSAPLPEVSIPPAAFGRFEDPLALPAPCALDQSPARFPFAASKSVPVLSDRSTTAPETGAFNSRRALGSQGALLCGVDKLFPLSFDNAVPHNGATSCRKEMTPVFSPAPPVLRSSKLEPVFEHAPGSGRPGGTTEWARLWEKAALYWRSGPHSRKVALVAVVAALAFFARPNGTVAAGPSDSGSVGTLLAGQWNSVQQNIVSRAAISLSDDFRSGLANWEGRGAWARSWSYDSAGFVRPGALALYRPSQPLEDYRMEFVGQIERNSIGWVFRAADLNNYYAAQLAIVKSGPLPKAAFVYYAVIDGKEGPRTETPLPMQVHNDTMYRVQTDVRGANFTVSVQGQVVHFWTDSRLSSGGVGFFSQRGERARVRWVEVSHQHDFVGKLCAFLAPYSVETKQRSSNQ